jgi:hypothetical protein
MNFSSRISPQDPFPEHLEDLTIEALEILNSKVHRQAEFEYQRDGESELETRFRLEFLAEELDRRENLSISGSASDAARDQTVAAGQNAERPKATAAQTRAAAQVPVPAGVQA